MRKTAAAKSHRVAGDDLRPEYRFDYSKARPNRFAGRRDKSRLVIALDPDISEVFTTPESVNRTLRALITAMPGITKPKAVRRSTSRTVKK
jgi:hypothetical protein